MPQTPDSTLAHPGKVIFAVAVLMIAAVALGILFSGGLGSMGERLPFALLPAGSFAAGALIAWLWRRRKA